MLNPSPGKRDLSFWEKVRMRDKEKAE